MGRLQNNPNWAQLFPSSSSGLLARSTSSPLPPASCPACFCLVPMLSTLCCSQPRRLSLMACWGVSFLVLCPMSFLLSLLNVHWDPVLHQVEITHCSSLSLHHFSVSSSSEFSLMAELPFTDCYTNTFHFPNVHNLKKVFFIILIHWYSWIMWLRLYLTFGPRQVSSMANFSPFSKRLPN